MSLNLPLLHEPLAIWLEDAWLQRYLDRELSDEECEWFEAYALDKPRLIDAIDADTNLRDGLHAWHAGQQGAESRANPLDDDSVSNVVDLVGTGSTTPVPRKTAPWFRPIAIAASLVLAGLLGASAARWAPMTDVAGGPIASPIRIVFDTLRGSDSSPLVEHSTNSSAPLLIDIAVPAQAESVVAHFADQSSLALPVSADGFVSLTGPRNALLQRSPIRIAWRLAGQPQERLLDLKATLARNEG